MSFFESLDPMSIAFGLGAGMLLSQVRTTLFVRRCGDGDDAGEENLLYVDIDRIAYIR